MRIAVASTDGKDVNEHFGKAQRFLIYDLTAEGSKFIDVRRSISLSGGDPDHPFDKDRFNKSIKAINDCARVYVVRIGDRPAQELKALGIEPVVFKGRIEDIQFEENVK
jgi:nitrogen fixation protein NifX